MKTAQSRAIPPGILVDLLGAHQFFIATRWWSL